MDDWSGCDRLLWIQVGEPDGKRRCTEIAYHDLEFVPGVDVIAGAGVALVTEVLFTPLALLVARGDEIEVAPERSANTGNEAFGAGSGREAYESTNMSS